MTKARETSVTMNYLYLLPDDDVSEDWKEGEDRWHGGLSIDDHEWNIVNLETICQVANTGAITIGMSDDDNFVATIDEFLLGEAVRERL